MTRPSLAGVEPFSATPWSFQPWGGQNQNGDYAESILFDAHGEALTYGLPNADGALIAAAPDLLAAVRDLLAAASDLDRHASRIVRAGDVADLIRTTIAAHLDLTNPEGDPT